MSRILVLGAGIYNVDVIKQLKNNGYYVICADKNPIAPGFKYSDEFSVVDIKSISEITNLAKEKKVNAIMPVSDFGTRAAFYASQKLSLINSSYLSGICANDKGIMRDVWSHDHLPQPNYMIFGEDYDVRTIINKIGFPLVVKPTDSGGAGRGISVAYNEKELIEAINHAKTFVSNGRYIAEEFIEGVEFTVDCLAQDGVVNVLAISDKVKPRSKYFVATSLNFPADIDIEDYEELKRLAIRASETLGLTNGASHSEFILSRDGTFKILEMGLRGGGGHLFGKIVEQVSGINAPTAMADILCGKKVDLSKVEHNGICYRFFNPSGRGIIKDIIVLCPEILTSDFIIDFGLTAKTGDSFNGLIDSMKRVGFVITKGSSREEAIKYADLVESNIKFIFDGDSDVC